MEAELWVGVDVSKARLDVALGESGELYRLTNDQRGIQELIARLRTLTIGVVVEATGGLETALVAELGAAGLPVA